jgi:DNA-binding CsgD family transcriptional regulator
VMSQQPVGSVVFSDEILPETDLVATEFWHDVLRPQGLIRNAMVPITRSGQFQGAFNILRTPRQGPFAERDRAVLRRVVPHLKRAMQLHLRVEAHEALAGAQFAVLDCLAMGVVVLDRMGAVIFANRAARALHAAGGPILLKDGTLTARLPAEAAAMSARLRAVAEGRAGGAVRLTDPGGARAAFALVAPLRGRVAGLLDNEGLRSAACAVFVSAGPPPPADARTMMRIYDLTPAEARVAAELAQGRSYAAIAGSLGISINTVKTHMRRILAKAGVDRPAEFASLAATLQLVRL